MLPLVLAVFQREPDPKRRAEALDLLEKLNFRYYITGIAPRSDSSQGELFRMAHSYYHGTLAEDAHVPDASTELCRQLIEFIRHNAGTRNFVKHLVLEKDESRDFYHWQGLKFFLASYEQYLCEKHNQHKPLAELLRGRNPKAHNDFLHREHILALGDDSISGDASDFLRRRLGNFVLLREGTNKGAGRMPVSHKIEYGYQSQGTIELYQLKELKDFFDAGTKFVKQDLKRVNQTWKYWQELLCKMFDLREKSLVNFALTRWGVDQLPDEPAAVHVDNFKKPGEVYRIWRKQETDVEA
ncbi:hypothetical protein [Desulfobulbus alkaliphilus]|uniref:hypothetical protein n=1 Tax=Desulfobulbus alkaliphilus TaxID=869814 RepID=UPI0019642AAC|nr:hypothetical protein [Desulfobulbus alkaliphilus]MBM9538814.1 hypothetical protein [Desulfobulbus alkaliphilus]